jgi:hypothetical protein
MAAPKKWYRALAHLSISRPAASDPKGMPMADLIPKGEKVQLDEETAQRFLTGHRVPVIRPAEDDESSDPQLKARDLFGERAPAQAFGARPDPPGSSTVTINPEVADPSDPRNAPEAHDPQPDASVDPALAKGTAAKAK